MKSLTKRNGQQTQRIDPSLKKNNGPNDNTQLEGLTSTRNVDNKNALNSSPQEKQNEKDDLIRIKNTNQQGSTHQNIVNQYTMEQMQIHRKIISEMWDYRYWRLVQAAIKTKNWMPIFAFIGQFKLKCVQIAKILLNQKFSRKQIDKVDHRYEQKGEGQIGIYLVDGIVVRIAKVSKSKKEFDKRAEKNLHQEFISYNIVNNLIISLLTESSSNFPSLRVPITCLVKYQGYTFLCQGDTMCNGIQTLVFGPMATTYKIQQSVVEILNVIGRNLNLKSFQVISANRNVIQIPFCLTVQLHQVSAVFRQISIVNWFDPKSPLYPHHQKQNKLLKPQYYLLSLSKLWPLFIDSNIVKSYGYTRPEAVLAWKKQLSNAVFTNIAFEKDEQGELQLAEACKNIKEQNVKELTKFLDEATFFVVDSPGIQQIMHYYRINVRFLGLVASKFTLLSNKKIFEIEMIARMLKKIFYTNIQGFEKYNFKDLVADFLNLVFINSKQGEKFFRDVVYPHVQKYYQYQMSQYPPQLTGGGLLHALAYHLGVKIKIVDYPFFKQIQSIFSNTHIIDIVPLARSFDLQTCLLKKSCEKVKNKKKDGLFSECITEFNLLATMARLSCPDGTYSVGSAPESYFYSQLADVYKFLKNEEETKKYADLALKKIPDKHADAIKSFCILIQYHSWKKEINRCLEYYEKSLANLGYHLQSNHPLSITVYNTLGYQFLNSTDPSKCQKIFAKSFQICEQSLGYMHATSGKILLQLAELPLPPEKTINFLLQALTILENIESDKEKIRNVCMKISEMYAKIGNLTKMIQFARRSDHWRMQIIALQKLNQYKMVLQLCGRSATNVNQLQFLIEKSFSSYVKLLDYTSCNYLYKVFISLVDNLPTQQLASERIFKKLTTQFSISMTIVEFVKASLNNLLIQVPELLKEADFFMGSDFLTQYKNQKLKSVIFSYMDILAIVGPEKSQNIFVQFRKNF